MAYKKKRNYEGETYRGGRTKGRKNLEYTDTGVVNQHGVEITKAERKALESAVTRANRKRAEMLEEAAKLPRKVAGRETGDTVGSLQLMGKESDFILARKSSSLQRFRTREDFDRYMTNLERVNNPGYVADRIRQYKRNFTTALLDTYGDEAKDIAMKIRMMKPEEYMRMVESDETLEIRYVPSDMVVSGRLEQLRAALGMKQKDDWVDEEYDIDEDDF